MQMRIVGKEKQQRRRRRRRKKNQLMSVILLGFVRLGNLLFSYSIGVVVCFPIVISVFP
jgi:hypothetical protein